MNRNMNIARAAILAAIYVAICAVLQPISFGPVQFRFSELLCLLSIDHLWALWGVTAGCFLANLLIGGLGAVDVIFGTLASFLACLAAYRFKDVRCHGYPLLSTFLIAAINGVIIGTELGFILETRSLIPAYILQVFIGELIVLAIGLPIYMKVKDMDFLSR